MPSRNVTASNKKLTGTALRNLMDHFHPKKRWRNTYILVVSIALVLWVRSLSQIADRFLPDKMWTHLLIIGLILLLFYGDDGQLNELHAMELETVSGVQNAINPWKQKLG